MENSTKNYAKPGLRLVAHLIDLLISMTVFLPLVLIASRSTNIIQALDSLVTILIFLVYFGILFPIFNSFLTSKYGGTIGKLLTGIKVTDEKGNLISLKRSLFRTFVGYSVSGVFFGLGFFWIYKDKMRRAWHDMATGSVVVISSSSLLFLGIASLTALFIVSVILAVNIVSNINTNKNVYIKTYEDIRNYFTKEEKSIPTEPPYTLPQEPDTEIRIKEDNYNLELI